MVPGQGERWALILNAGSSSLKAALLDLDTEIELATSQADWAGQTRQYVFRRAGQPPRKESFSGISHADAVRRLVLDLRAHWPDLALSAVGHRVVHGGPFTAAVRVTELVRDQIRALVELAPLHNPASLATLDAAQELFPQSCHVAVFDTAFHASLPPEAWTYPVPASWTRDWGIRRYGFHGLSHSYCSQRAAELLGRSDLRVIILHLGHGCSASAVAAGKCMDTTMGFTPLEGLMMATRSGSIDPAIIPFVLQQPGQSVETVKTQLNRQSGLLGVSELSADMREILQARSRGHAGATLAFAMYCRRVRQAIGAAAVTLGGVDAIVFTAGVGENSPDVREEVCRGLECLGLELDPDLNRNCCPDTDVALGFSRSRILVIATREDKSMLREIRQVVGGT